MKYVLFSLMAEALISGSSIGLPGPTSDSGVIANALSVVYFWAGVIAVGLIVYGGFLYVLSNGDSSRVKKAKDTLLYSVIGLIVVIIAAGITNLVIKGVNGG